MPVLGLQEVVSINPLDDVTAFASQVDYTANTMVVGHLPFLERLISFLITGRQSPTVFKLQNGGILCLPFLPIFKFTGAESVTGKVSLVQCGYFFSRDLEKVFTVILRHQVLG